MDTQTVGEHAIEIDSQHPWMFMPGRALTPEEMTEMLRLMGISVSDDIYSQLSPPLRTQFSHRRPER